MFGVFTRGIQPMLGRLEAVVEAHPGTPAASPAARRRTGEESAGCATLHKSRGLLWRDVVLTEETGLEESCLQHRDTTRESQS